MKYSSKFIFYNSSMHKAIKNQTSLTIYIPLLKIKLKEISKVQLHFNSLPIKQSQYQLISLEVTSKVITISLIRYQIIFPFYYCF